MERLGVCGIGRCCFSLSECLRFLYFLPALLGIVVEVSGLRSYKQNKLLALAGVLGGLYVLALFVVGVVG